MPRGPLINCEESRKGKGVKKGHEEGGKYARYTQEQIEVLERAYTQCPNPNHLQRAQIMSEHHILSGVDPKQLKVWFQNRRCREKQKKENCVLLSENRRLTASNKLLREENDGLQRKLDQLICENENMRSQVLSLTSDSSSEMGHQPEANNPQMPIRMADNNRSLLLMAEETREEFLSKAVGNAIHWIPASGLKLHSLYSVGTLCVSSTEDGVAARACVTMPVDPVKTVEILKDKPSWYRSCRTMNVTAKYPVNGGGTIELVYTQYYAPTILACARDFWTLRYTSVLDDGSFVVCEKSISSCDAAPSSPAALEFIRGTMLASGFLVCPVEGGSSVYLVHHLNLEAPSVPVVVRPLHESSEIVVKKMVISALHYIQHMIDERDSNESHISREDPTFLRSYSQKLCRGFDDAVNCFSDDGWALINTNVTDDIIMSIKQTKNAGVHANFDSVICVKASLLLQNVHPARMVRILKARRSVWMDFNFADHSVAFSRAASFAYPGPNIHQFIETSVLLGHTGYDDERFEVVRFGRQTDHQSSIYSGDLYHVQIISGMEDTVLGSCSELIFAPIFRSTSNDCALLSSGFRIFSLGPIAGATSNEASNIKNAQTDVGHTTSLLILAFQFPFESHLQEDVAVMARQYVQSVVSSVKNLCVEAMYTESYPNTNCLEINPAIESTPEQDFAVNLANLVHQSYRSTLGMDMTGFSSNTANSTYDKIEQHQYAILCFSFSSFPLCLYANQSALNILETTPDKLQMLTIDRILDGSNNMSLFSILPTVMQQGYAILPPGQCLSVLNHPISYGQGVVWLVRAPQGSIHCLALAFMDCSFN